MEASLKLNPEYKSWLTDIKSRIRQCQIKATLSVNSQMIMLYWDMGRQIVEKQERAKWGSRLIEQLSKDLIDEFPGMTGFSRTNLFRMKRFYQFYSTVEQYKKYVPPHPQQMDDAFIPQVVGQMQVDKNQSYDYSEHFFSKVISIPWGHNVCIIEQVKDVDQALFYIHQTIENNWSRAVLVYQIETNLYDNRGKAITNFNITLPAPQSDLATELMRDPYNFDFLCLSKKVKETELEKALVQHISQFLPALGIGFAYMGRQFLLKVGSKDYRIDLLFYHTRLKCYVIIELKIREFEPEFVGKLNFYITAVNELVKDEYDKQTIGMLLCRNKDNYEVGFSLKDINNPIGVSTFHYTELADDIKAVLPSAEELQSELINFERELKNAYIK